MSCGCSLRVTQCGHYGHGRKNGLTPFSCGFPKELGLHLRRSGALAGEGGFFFPRVTTVVAMSHRFPLPCVRRSWIMIPVCGYVRQPSRHREDVALNAPHAVIVPRCCPLVN